MACRIDNYASLRGVAGEDSVNGKNNRGFRGAFDTYPLTKSVVLFGLVIGTIAAFFSPEASVTISGLVITAAVILGIFLESS